MDTKLREVRVWAEEKIAQGSEPPWAWYQYMKLIETIRAIEAGMGTITPTGKSRQLEERSGRHLRPVDSTYSPDSAQPHPSGLPAQLPM